MANSLMELYGGGMAGKSNNYQLGGRIARARRGREYQGEMRALQEKQKKAAKAKRTSGLLGSVGSFLGGTIGSALGPWGTAAGAGIGRALGESTYGKSDFSGGKYRQQTREDLTEGERDYRKGIGERALVTAAQAGIMPGIYEKAGAALKTGMGKAGQAFREAQTTGELFGFGEGVKEFGRELGTQFGGKMPMEMLSAPSTLATTAAGVTTPAVVDTASAAIAPPELTMPSGFGSDMTGKLAGMPTTIASEVAPELVSGTAAGLGFGEIAPDVMSYAPSDEWFSGYDSMSGYDPMSMFNPYQKGGGWIPKMQGGGRAGTEYDPTRPQQQQQKQNPFGGFDASNIFTGFGPGSFTGSNLYGGQGAFQYAGDTGVTGSGGTFNPSAGYGTATGAIGALQQMGMGDVASDPRLQQYLQDLPQFSMGYEQKVGDYRTGAQQGLLGLAQSGASGAGGFAGSGAATTQSQQQRQQMVDQFGRQRRGVVEGYQADVLGAIADIEQKGEFEFGSGWSDADASKAASLVKNAASMVQSKLPAQTGVNQNTTTVDPMQDWYDQQYG